jgi:hypothetical protein
MVRRLRSSSASRTKAVTELTAATAAGLIGGIGATERGSIVKVKLRRPQRVGGKGYKVGEVVECTLADAKMLCSSNGAEILAEAPSEDETPADDPPADNPPADPPAAAKPKGKGSGKGKSKGKK